MNTKLYAKPYQLAEVNLAKLKSTYERMAALPENLIDMQQYVRATPCGTARCVAGDVVINEYAQKGSDAEMFFEGDYFYTAKEILNLSQPIAEWLFYAEFKEIPPEEASGETLFVPEVSKEELLEALDFLIKKVTEARQSV